MTGAAQITPGKISFALPDHPGSLSFDQGKFNITELSAKPNNSEFGVRAEDGDLKFLGFFFLWPEKPHLTSESCRDEMLKAEGPQALAADQGRLLYTTPSGVHTAMVLLIPPSEKFSALRVFVAHEDLCADLTFTYAQPPTKAAFPMDRTKLILNSLVFDHDAKPTFREAFAYATVEWDKQQLRGAAKAYASALKLVDSSDDPVKWRRVTTDQLSMSLGMSGDLQGSRAVNQAAIERDPTYPLYYYDLACADAESGDPAAARFHLQQAFDRRANTLKGETFPDPTNVDSLKKLKGDKDFWNLAESISLQLKKS
jgi:tetratricopeptide (TPR) repeat protein